MAGNIRGEITRAKILRLLRIHAYSMALLADELMLSEATVLYHLRILQKQNVVTLYKVGNQLYAQIRQEIEDFRKSQPFLSAVVAKAHNERDTELHKKVEQKTSKGREQR